MLIAIAVILGLALLYFVLGWFLAGFSMGIKRQTMDGARAWQADHYDISFYDRLEKTDFTVSCSDGYQLHAQLLRNPEGKDRCVLISHGYTDNRFGSLKYARLYLALGFHVILYDLRGHGMNEPTFCTYSIREGQDLDLLIRYCRKNWPGFRVFGIQGESLGSATSIGCLKYHPPIDFVVADCGFSEIQSVMTAGLRAMHLPAFLIHAASCSARLRYGYSISKMRPMDSLRGSQVPILFIHGADDDFILPLHSQRMYELAEGYKEIHLIPGAGHAASALVSPEEYSRILAGFLSHIGIHV